MINRVHDVVMFKILYIALLGGLLLCGLVNGRERKDSRECPHPDTLQTCFLSLMDFVLDFSTYALRVRSGQGVQYGRSCRERGMMLFCHVPQLFYTNQSVTP